MRRFGTLFILSVCLILCLMVTETDADLVGYWSFDQEDGVKDLSGNGHNGIIHGNPLFVDGRRGEALEFNGLNDYVAIPHDPAISELETLSVAAWIQAKRHGTWVAVIEKGVHENWSYGFFVEPDGTLSFEISTSPNNNLICCVGDVELNIGEWYHIFGSYDGEFVRVYVNGKLEGTMKASDPVHITEGLPLTIGSRNGRNHFTGIVDELALWDSAISVNEAMHPFPVQSRDKLPTTWSMIKSRYKFD